MPAIKGNTVQVHYTGKLTDGTVFDSSIGKDPLEFVIGESMVIPKFEETVEKMEVGTKQTVKIDAEEAYGEYMEELSISVEKDNFPDDFEPQLGNCLEIPHEDGEVVSVQITAINDKTITLDANHPLAGQDLIFDIELVKIV